MLAQIQNVDPNFFHQFALVLAGLLAGAGAAVGIWAAIRKRPLEPQPLVTAEAERYATRDFVAERADEVNRRLAGHDQDIRELYAEMKKDREAAEIHASQRSAAIYTKIDDLSKETQHSFRELERSIGRLENAVAPKPQ